MGESRFGGGRSRDAAEHRSRNESRPCRVVEVENPSDHFAGRIQPGDRIEVQVYDLRRLGNNSKSAEREGYAAGNGLSLEGRRIERIGPVRFRRIDADGAATIPYSLVEWHVGLHRSVEVAHRLQEVFGIDAL